MPLSEISSHGISYCTTTSAAQVRDGACASLVPGESVWLEVRVKAVSSTRSWYAAIAFFARCSNAGAITIDKKVLAESYPEGRVKWAVDVIADSPGSVALVCAGEDGQSVDWAISSRGFDRN